MNKLKRITVDGRLWRHAPDGAARVCPGSPVTDWQVSEAIQFCNKLSLAERLIPAYAPVHRWEWRDVPGATGWRVCPRSDSLEIERRVYAPSVTRQAFSRILGGTRDEGPLDGPVQFVSWYDAIAFCNKLSLAEGLTPVYSVNGVNFTTLTYAQIPTGSNGDWNAATEDCEADGYRIPDTQGHENVIVESTADVTAVALPERHWLMGDRSPSDEDRPRPLWLPDGESTGILAVRDTMTITPAMVDAVWGECLGTREEIHLYLAMATLNKLSLLHGLDPAYPVHGVDWTVLRPSEIPTAEHEDWTHAARYPDTWSGGYALAIHREPPDSPILIKTVDRVRKWNFIFQTFEAPYGIGLRSGVIE